jgi:hypothetical protein
VANFEENCRIRKQPNNDGAGEGLRILARVIARHLEKAIVIHDTAAKRNELTIPAGNKSSENSEYE